MWASRSRFSISYWIPLAACAVLFAGCEGDTGSRGADGAPGQTGAPGPPGTSGPPAGSTVGTTDSAGDVTFEILPVGNTLAGAGAFALKFKARTLNAGTAVPLTGLDKVAIYSAAAKPNTSGTGAHVEWSNTAAAQGRGSSMFCTLDGMYTDRGVTGEACKLVEDPSAAGTYTGTWSHTGTAPIMNPQDDLTVPHRVFLRAYNLKDPDGVAISDKVLSARMDYVPATGVVLETTGKDTVTDASCIGCHGAVDGRIAKIAAHSNYQSTENCVACHNPGLVPTAAQAAEGWVYDFAPMVHRLHAGEHNAALLSGDAKEYFGEIAFPNELTNCVGCHDNGDTWNTAIYAAACTGCHMNVNFATGAGHSINNLVEADDRGCVSCHGAGSLTPVNAHKVGKRAEYANLMTVDFTSITAGVPSGGNTTLTLKANITLNGAPIPDGASLTTYNATTNPTGRFMVNSLLIGTVAANGTTNSWRDVLAGAQAVNLGQGTLSGGVWTATKTVPDALATGTMYIGSEATLCIAAGALASCGAANLDFGPGTGETPVPVGNNSPLKFFNVSGGAVTLARMAKASELTVEEVKCNACHGSLDYVKGYRHGLYTMAQCQNCHSDTASASGHKTVRYKGETGLSVTNPSIAFDNKDLVTVAHRFHSGNFDVIAGIFRDYTGELFGYPAEEKDCSMCHKEDKALFAADGGLSSGKRSIRVGFASATTGATPTPGVPGVFISPVTESCRSCHAHSDGAAVAHFVSNGAVLQADAVVTSNLPIESCATCHAEGKSYGVNKVHARGAVL